MVPPKTPQNLIQNVVHKVMKSLLINFLLIFKIVNMFWYVSVAILIASNTYAISNQEQKQTNEALKHKINKQKGSEEGGGRSNL
jgi:hypothetical protein